ncbi:hypothetical protein LCGC14_0558550 [marine sediment metagenome]|uniref:Disease resistance R13L4/SHOC-2-like LRR domain-containing protein n=1 Tax=marine sediment metagenome TaxID=412755 RepID=A0A0F9U979_9ZZZZ|nr:leucine-rich repeat domain-containing protein [bacterium]
MSEFKVNDYITLKLENGKTEIYLQEERFIQCKYLLINIPIEKYERLGEGMSIDSAEINLSHALEIASKSNYRLPHEVEFWAHCSNLQVWAENSYNTKLLHRSIAFPLLKKLAKIGDTQARRVFKDEIGIRFSEGNLSVILYLLVENYVDAFNSEEKETLFYNNNKRLRDNIEIGLKEKGSSRNRALLALKELTELGDSFAKKRSLIEFNKKVRRKRDLINDLIINDRYFSYLDNETMFRKLLKENDADNIIKLTVFIEKNWRKLKHFLKWAESYRKERLFLKPLIMEEDFEDKNEDLTFGVRNQRVAGLQLMGIEGFFIEEFPKMILEFDALELLSLTYNKISLIPPSISNLVILSHLDLSHNPIERLPEEICHLKSLKVLKLDSAKIKNLPEGLAELKSLEKLSLYGNRLDDLPESIGRLKNLTSLDLSRNRIKYLPKTILQLKNLQFVDIDQKHKHEQVVQKLIKNRVFISFH